MYILFIYYLCFLTLLNFDKGFHKKRQHAGRSSTLKTQAHSTQTCDKTTMMKRPNAPLPFSHHRGRSNWDLLLSSPRTITTISLLINLMSLETKSHLWTEANFKRGNSL